MSGKTASYSTTYSRDQVKNFSMYNSQNEVASVHPVDLRSDTVTKPCRKMRKAIAEAEVGDDVMQEDPTVNELERTAAKMLGKEEALYVSSGTMGNLVSIMAHTDHMRATDIIVGDKSHIFCYEQGGAAQVAGVMFNTVKNKPDGTFDLDEVEERIHLDSHDVHYPTTALICVENTHNKCGGRVLPYEWLQKVVEYAKERKIPLHMDGARLFNAVIQSGVSAAEITKGFDSVSICLSKGLGAPVGSILVGSKTFIKNARRYRKVLGGGMRQAGIIAAAGLYALKYNISRLAEDHSRTYEIAKTIADSKSDIIKVNLADVQTNILFMYFTSGKVTPDDFGLRMVTVTEKERQDLNGRVCAVQMFSMDRHSARIVLHNCITAEDVELAIEKLKYVIKEFEDKFA
ncbi:uncharacterized protein LOC142329673 isoform X2 [Lycorma delicatula]|uniref:uncharacterized protein LOC142329673 isoform X2 n=1 Tax=Lycorma delicatula TaxID=130591 RepID=UPI003F514710